MKNVRGQKIGTLIRFEEGYMDLAGAIENYDDVVTYVQAGIAKYVQFGCGHEQKGLRDLTVNNYAGFLNFNDTSWYRDNVIWSFDLSDDRRHIIIAWTMVSVEYYCDGSETEFINKSISIPIGWFDGSIDAKSLLEEQQARAVIENQIEDLIKENDTLYNKSNAEKKAVKSAEKEKTKFVEQVRKHSSNEDIVDSLDLSAFDKKIQSKQKAVIDTNQKIGENNKQLRILRKELNEMK